MNGWISISRKIKNNWLWKEKRKFSKFEAWIDILLKANYFDEVVQISSKQKVLIQRGGFISSELKLAEEWRWSRDTVRKFLKQLEADEMILMKHTTKYTMIVVVNWDLYQMPQQQNRQQVKKNYNKLDNSFCKKHTLQEILNQAKMIIRHTRQSLKIIQQTVHRLII